MTRSIREVTELRQYFAIKTDLAAAVRAAAPDDIEFHLGELAAMQMHTTSARLSRACRAAISGWAPTIAAVTA